jgi:ribosomal-protein-alanine N-acetyltransferase
MPRAADVEVREAAPADIAAVHAIELESFPQPWRPEFFSHELSVEGRLNLVAVQHGAVIGYVFAMWILDEMHINKIAVDRRARRSGVADALMDRCFEFARRHDIVVVSLEVRRSNAEAQAFYHYLGFEAAYARRRYYPDGEDAVVMTRNVTLP